MKGSIVFHRVAIALLIPIGLASCTPQSETRSTTAGGPAKTIETTTATETIETTTAAEPSTPTTSAALAANNYCYEKEAGDVHTYGRINIDADNKVSGGIQHDFPPAGGDVSSILISIDGTANGNTLDLSKSSFSEYDGGWNFVPGKFVDTESAT